MKCQNSLEKCGQKQRKNAQIGTKMRFVGFVTNELFMKKYVEE